MPVNRSADYYLGGQPFILERTGPWKGRAWRRSSQVNVPGGPTTREEGNYSRQPEQIDFVEVWNDWSGGYGYPYRTGENPNTYHWGENIDLRWPGQGVHCQEIVRGSDPAASIPLGVQNNVTMITDIPVRFRDLNDPNPDVLNKPAGTGDIILLSASAGMRLAPRGPKSFITNTYASFASPLDYGGRIVLCGSLLFVGVNSGTGFSVFRPDLHVPSANDMRGRGFALSGNRLWRWWADDTQPAKYINSTSIFGNGVFSAANWSATLSVGDGRGPIQDAIALNEQLFLGLPDGLYAGDQGGTFYNVLADLGNQKHHDNCRDLAIHNGRVVAQAISGIYAYERVNEFASQVTDLGLPQGDRSPARGFPRALRAYGPWIHAGVWTGSRSWLVAGTEASPGLPYVWHTMHRLPDLARVHRLHFDSVTVAASFSDIIPNRMWISTDPTLPTSGTAPLYFLPIPPLNGNPLAPNVNFSAAYIGSARFDLGNTDRNAPGTRKVYRMAEVWADSLLSGAQYADIYYSIDQGTRTLLGRAQTSPVTQLYFPSTTGSFTMGRSIELSVESFTSSASTTPVYRSIVLHGAILADAVDVIQAQTRVADNLKDRRGAPMRSGAQMLKELRQFASPSWGPIELIDLAGATQLVKVLPPIDESEVYQEGQENPEVSAGVRMAVLSFSAS